MTNGTEIQTVWVKFGWKQQFKEKLSKTVGRGIGGGMREKEIEMQAIP